MPELQIYCRGKDHGARLVIANGKPDFDRDARKIADFLYDYVPAGTARRALRILTKRFTIK